MVTVPNVEWVASDRDVYDGMTWTEDAVNDLIRIIRNGGTVEDVAQVP